MTTTNVLPVSHYKGPKDVPYHLEIPCLKFDSTRPQNPKPQPLPDLKPENPTQNAEGLEKNAGVEVVWTDLHPDVSEPLLFTNELRKRSAENSRM